MPRRPGLTDLDDLDGPDLARLVDDVRTGARLVRELGRHAGRPVRKLNVGALGNLVPQLHVHVIGRRSDDEAWPSPVWGYGARRPYDAGELAARLSFLRDCAERGA